MCFCGCAHPHDTKQKVSVSNRTQQKIKHLMLTQAQDQGSSPESCIFVLYSSYADEYCNIHTKL